MLCVSSSTSGAEVLAGTRRERERERERERGVERTVFTQCPHSRQLRRMVVSRHRTDAPATNGRWDQNVSERARAAVGSRRTSRARVSDDASECV